MAVTLTTDIMLGVILLVILFIIASLLLGTRRRTSLEKSHEVIIKKTGQKKELLVDQIKEKQKINLKKLSRDINISEDLINYIIVELLKNGEIDGEFSDNGDVFFTRFEISRIIREHLET